MMPEDLKGGFHRPVSGLSLAFVRMALAFCIIWEIGTSLFYEEDFIYRSFILPDFHYKHYLFTWIPTWPSLGAAYFHHFAIIVSSFAVLIGFHTRIALAVTFLLFGYLFFVDYDLYQNHYYLMLAALFLFIWLPSESVWSIDSLRERTGEAGTVPVWTVWSVRLFVETALLYAGLVKLTPDWLKLEPLGSWLRNRADWHVFGDLLYHDWFIALGAYGAIAIHLLGAPLLLFKRTRLWAFCAYAVFHALNAYTFDLRTFPYITLAMTTIFFNPEWPQTLLFWLGEKFRKIKNSKVCIENSCKKNSSLFPLLCVMAILISQIVLPLRTWFYAGNTNWTQEGSQFSWRMKLYSHKSFSFFYVIKDETTEKSWTVDPRKYLRPRQYEEAANNPEFILQFSHYLQKIWLKKGYPDIQVYAYALNSLNGRRPSPLIDPKVDLTKKNWNDEPRDWILPLTEPFTPWKKRDWCNLGCEQG